MTSLAKSAIWYARHGWRVFPCIARDKRPAIEAWQKLATTDPRQVSTWWSSRPQSNIGIACGAKSDLYVIDVDVKEGRNGESDLERLIDRLGALPDTPLQRTGSGGRQYFLRMPDGKFRNSRGKVAPSIDTRAGGGYVVAPPSLHPCGEPYRWIYGPHELETAELPPSWCDALRVKEPARLTVPVQRHRALDSMADEIIERRVRAIQNAQSGTRNDLLYRSAFMLAMKARSGLLQWADASAALLHAALAAGLDQREAAATIRSAERGAGSCR